MMILLTFIISSIANEVLTAVGHMLKKCYTPVGQSVKQKEEEEEVQNDIFYQVIFFPDQLQNVVYGNSNSSMNECSLQRLIDYISAASRSLDLCLYIFSCRQLLRVVTEVHRKGVAVRLIIDVNQADADGSCLKSLRSLGIPIRKLGSPTVLLHHKFALIDKEILVNGSFNWTRQAVINNHENILITNNNLVVRPYVDEYERLWNS